MRLAVAAAVVLALVASAHADKNTAEARALYEKGTAHYDLAEYDAAVVEFRKAYELSHEPGLLFNIAQSYRLAKDYQQALYFYRTYLALRPDAANRADAEAQIAKMKAALATAPSAPKPPEHGEPPASTAAPPAVTPSPLPTTAAPPPPAPPGFAHTRRGRATIALAIVGGAALVAAAATGGGALSIRSSYDTGCAMGPCDADLYDRGRGLAIATDVLIPVGVAAALAATLVGLVRPHQRPMTLGMSF